MERNLVAPVASALVLLSAVLLSACDGGGSPSAPSPSASPEPSPAPAPIPDLSRLVGVWNLTVRLTDVSGSGCVAETMRSQIGVPNRYSLSIAQKGNYSVAVTLKSAAGDRACTFAPSVDSSGFTTYGKGGYYTCEHEFLDFGCSDGTPHSIFTLGEDISGRVLGNEISGAWDATWIDGWDGNHGVDVKAQYTGNRQ